MQNDQTRIPRAGSSSMNKTDLIKRLAATHPDLLSGDVARIVDTVLEEMAAALCQGQRVELRGFGSFDLRRRPARVGRNPRTGAQVEIPAKAALHFKTGKDLNRRLNEDAHAASPEVAAR